MLAVLLIALTAGVLVTHPEVVDPIIPDHWNSSRSAIEELIVENPHAPTVQPNWQPSSWDGNAYNTQKMVSGFVDSDIIYNAYFEPNWGTPTVKVGPNFYRLSTSDKANVMAYMNQAYNITSTEGGFLIKDWRSGKTIGSYSRNGLTLL